MNLVERVKRIILTPKTEWPVIAGEPGDAGYLFGNYVAILAAIPAVCGFIGAVLIGVPVLFALIAAVVKYILAFVAVYIVALIVDLLAPTFGSQKNFASALKVTVYSYTPVWLAGVFSLIPALSFLAILGLYGLYLLWLGLPQLMRTPAEKSIWYTITIVICAIVVAIVLLAITAVIGLRRFG
ncbi:MAG TPA: Yip1 family protein [Xanthobacteraceae bacterium]|nr:Yip1 family protein [Xanthobacteraceae bacterium]